jgi:hypothetical protein
MDPSVEAAVISGSFGLLGVAGTVIVALAGFRANLRIAANVARDGRTQALWEKRCEAYVDVLTALDIRQADRSRLLLVSRQAVAAGLANIPRLQADRYLAAFHDPDGTRIRATLLAYASPAVKTFYWQVIVDDIALDVRIRFLLTAINADRIRERISQTRAKYESGSSPREKLDFSGLDEQGRRVSGFPSTTEAWAEVEKQRAVVVTRETSLTDQIRRELGSEPPRFGGGARLWHRLPFVPGRPAEDAE